MLSFEIGTDGGVEIRGTEKELLDLASWIAIAVKQGSAQPIFVADRELAFITIVKEGG